MIVNSHIQKAVSVVFSKHNIQSIVVTPTSYGVTLEFNGSYKLGEWKTFDEAQSVAEGLKAVNRIVNAFAHFVPVTATCSTLLTQERGNQSRVADLLNINRGTLHKELTKKQIAEPYLVFGSHVYKYFREFNKI